MCAHIVECHDNVRALIHNTFFVSLFSFLAAPDVGKPVKLRVTTTSIRIKLTNSSNTLVQDFPVFKVSYCGTDKKHKEAVTIVAKESG